MVGRIARPLALVAAAFAAAACGAGDTWEGTYSVDRDGERFEALRVERRGEQWIARARLNDDAWGDEVVGTLASTSELTQLMGEAATRCHASALALEGGALIRVDRGCEFRNGEVSETGWIVVVLFFAAEAHKH